MSNETSILDHILSPTEKPCDLCHQIIAESKCLQGGAGGTIQCTPKLF